MGSGGGSLISSSFFFFGFAFLVEPLADELFDAFEPFWVEDAVDFDPTESASSASGGGGGAAKLSHSWKCSPFSATNSRDMMTGGASRGHRAALSFPPLPPPLLLLSVVAA